MPSFNSNAQYLPETLSVTSETVVRLFNGSEDQRKVSAIHIRTSNPIRLRLFEGETPTTLAPTDYYLDSNESIYLDTYGMNVALVAVSTSATVSICNASRFIY